MRSTLAESDENAQFGTRRTFVKCHLIGSEPLTVSGGDKGRQNSLRQVVRYAFYIRRAWERRLDDGRHIVECLERHLKCGAVSVDRQR